MSTVTTVSCGDYGRGKSPSFSHKRQSTPFAADSRSPRRGGLSSFTKGYQSLPVCSHPKCVKAATVLTYSMNTNVKPCDNFYQFACGRYPASFRAVPNGPIISWVENLRSYVDSRIYEYVNRPLSPSDPAVVSQARIMYRSCLDIDAIDQRGYVHLKDFLDSINVPIVPVFQKDAPVYWLPMMAKTVQTGVLQFMFTLDVSGDLNNRRLNTVQLRRAYETPLVGRYQSNKKVEDLFNNDDNSALRFPSEPSVKIAAGDDVNRRLNANGLSEVNQQNKPAFIKFVLGAMRLLKNEFRLHSIDIDHPQLLQDVEELYDFVCRKDELLDRSYAEEKVLKQFSLRTMQKKTDKITGRGSDTTINWAKYLDHAFSGIFKNEFEFDEDDTVVVLNWEYFLEASLLLSKTDSRIIAMAVWFSSLKTFSSVTTKELKYLYDTYRQEIGARPPLPRERQCCNAIDSDFPMAISYMWTSDPDAYEKKNKASLMARLIMDVFKRIIKNARWMNFNTKNSAIEKVSAMEAHIAFPRSFSKHEELNRQLDDFKNYDNDYIRSKLAFRRRLKRKNLESMFEKNSKEEEEFAAFPTEVTAMYSPVTNALTVPYAVLHPPYYDYGIEALDYGSMGMVIAHEITHGFDDAGKNYDNDGNNIPWMTKDTAKKFRDEAQCFKDSFSNLLVPEINENVNGQLTLNENIADSGGMSIAYEAYQILKQTRQQYTLPGFENYTLDQLFTLGFAMTQCGYYPPWYLHSHVHSDEHTPYEQRINGIMMNFDKFETIWGCPKNAPMNPPKKCKIW